MLHYESLFVIESIRLFSIVSLLIPVCDMSIPRCLTGLLLGLMFQGRGSGCHPRQITSILFIFTVAWDHRLYISNVSIKYWVSRGDDSAMTQSSAKARDFTTGCPIALIPLILLLIVLRKVSKVKLYSIGDSGSPCLRPLVGITGLVTNWEVLTLIDMSFKKLFIQLMNMGGKLIVLRICVRNAQSTLS